MERDWLPTRARVGAYLSRKIKLLSLFAAIGVVYIHAYNYTDRFLLPTTILSEGLTAGALVEYCISNAMARFANPVFFAVSGFLFFVGFRKFTASGYRDKIGKRLNSLMLPFFLWNGFWTLVCCLLYLPGRNFYYAHESIDSLLANPIEFWTGPKPAFQLWFLIELFKLTLFSPVIYVLVTRMRVFAVILFAIPWAIDYALPLFSGSDGILFFTLGAYLALCDVPFPGREAPVRNCVWKYLIPCLWIAACAGFALLSGYALHRPVPEGLRLAAYKLCCALGFVSVYLICSALSERLAGAKWLQAAESASFLLYVLHEPFQHILFYDILNYTGFGWMNAALYFGLPIFFLALAIAVSTLLRRFCPKLRTYLTGGR